MKINNELVDVLDSFSKINPHILIRPGNVIRTVNPGENVLGSYTYDGDDFGQEVGLGNIREFLSVIGLIENPELEFNDQMVIIKNDISKAVYFLTAPELVEMKNKNDIPPEESNIQFVLKNEDINKLRRASSMINAQKIIITSGNNIVNFTLVDEDNPTSNEFQLSIDAKCEEGFEGAMFIEHLILMKGDYYVAISESGIALFMHNDISLKYWIILNDIN